MSSSWREWSLLEGKYALHHVYISSLWDKVQSTNDNFFSYVTDQQSFFGTKTDMVISLQQQNSHSDACTNSPILTEIQIKVKNKDEK